MAAHDKFTFNSDLNSYYNFDNSATFRNYWADNSEEYELIIRECGYEQCDSLHCWGPNKKDFHCVHYVLTGKGAIVIENVKYYVSAGDLFYLGPEDSVYYWADEDEPWEYRWISLSGVKPQYVLNKTVLPDVHVLTLNGDRTFVEIMEKMFESLKIEEPGKFMAMGYAYIFLGEILSKFGRKSENSSDPGKLYVDNAIRFIQNNYTGDCSVSSVAQNLNIDRTYIYKLFRKYVGMSPTDYIEKLRISRACELLRTSGIPLARISEMVGYRNQYHFSRVFKNRMGMAPRIYSQEHSEKSEFNYYEEEPENKDTKE